MATTAVSITVPDGLAPGNEFAVEWGGVSYSIAVPDGVFGGQELQIELPALEAESPAPSTPGMTGVTIVVPDGCFPGSEFAVEWGGVSYSIAVPDGVGPGQELQIELPALDAGGAPASTSRESSFEQTSAPAPAPAPAPASALGPAPAPAPAPAGLMGVFDLSSLGINLDDVLQNAVESEVNAVAEFEAWKPAGEHYIGKPIKVLRSNGEYSPAVVEAYDEIMETYTVNVGEPGTTWGIKYGVESGEIAPADHIAAMAGEFVTGLRVTVPHIGARIKHRAVDRDDVMGEIHGFDINDLTYTIRLDNGKTVRGVKGDQIRPLPKKGDGPAGHPR